jgi:hypothetical protein
MTDEELEKWLELKNSIAPRIPKVAKVEIGKAVYRQND